MSRAGRRAASAPDELEDRDSARPPRRRRADGGERPDGGQPSLAGLGIAGISRRRAVALATVAIAAWIALGFAGQATEAARAAERAGQERAVNEALASRVAGLEDELDLVVQQRWFLQQARAYAMGTSGERPFALAPGAPSLPPDAPGSPERQIGAEPSSTSPLESWLDVLFGPAPGG